jgi:hypothetical protein
MGGLIRASTTAGPTGPRRPSGRYNRALAAGLLAVGFLGAAGYKAEAAGRAPTGSAMAKGQLMTATGQSRTLPRIGDLVYDIEREAIGRVAYIDTGGNLAWVKPQDDGPEWTALPEQLRPAVHGEH